MSSEHKDSIELQLSELEMLKSMFPDPKELDVDEITLSQLHAYVEGVSNFLQRLKYSITFTDPMAVVTLHVALPTTYPSEAPDLYLRSNELSRDAQRLMNEELNEYICSFGKGDLVIGAAVAWLQDNILKFVEMAKTKPDSSKPSESSKKDKEQRCRRIWVYSHHIYSKVKRKDIRELADEYQLTGFCLPGKPGIICVEGSLANVNTWWHIVRSWNWQKLVCKRQEDGEDREDVKFNRFEDFQELGSATNIRVKNSGFHVDMGDVFRYLETHSSGYIFEELFGVPGK